MDPSEICAETDEDDMVAQKWTNLPCQIEKKLSTNYRGDSADNFVSNVVPLHSKTWGPPAVTLGKTVERTLTGNGKDNINTHREGTTLGTTLGTTYILASKLALLCDLLRYMHLCLYVHVVYVHIRSTVYMYMYT